MTSWPLALVEQQSLAECLQRLGTRLQQQCEADPVLVMETALAAVALTRTWLESDTVQAALASVPLDQLAWWKNELREDEAYVARLRQAVEGELARSLQPSNGHHAVMQAPVLLPGTVPVPASCRHLE